jgi:protein-S-isoprenylcysteine O-methyltransferase Ste14
MHYYHFEILMAAWFFWAAPFIRLRREGGRVTPVEVDHRARWGILVTAVGFAVVWFNPRVHPPDLWRVGVAVACFLPGILLTWTARRALGRHWRIDAGLDADHRLVRSGPYRFVRHPIYTAMLCSLVGTGFLLTPLPRIAAAFAIAVIGTEIRVRFEDRLLVSRFGEVAKAYQREVAAYVPGVR